MSDIPEHVERAMDFWVDALPLDGFEVTLSLERLTPGQYAEHRTRQLIRQSEVVLDTSQGDDDLHELSVIHELLHICHVDVDHVVRHVIIPSLPEACQEMALAAYFQQHEMFIDKMAKALYKLLRAEEKE